MGPFLNDKDRVYLKSRQFNIIIIISIFYLLSLINYDDSFYYHLNDNDNKMSVFVSRPLQFLTRVSVRK